MPRRRHTASGPARGPRQNASALATCAQRAADRLQVICKDRPAALEELRILQRTLQTLHLELIALADRS